MSLVASPMKSVARSGSLNSRSSNRALPPFAAQAAPPSPNVALSVSLDDMRHFSPGRDTDPAPESWK